VAVGGRGTLYGAIAGAVLVNYAKTYFTGAFPEVWLYALGALFVLVTIFLPHGIIGFVSSRVTTKKQLPIPGGEVEPAQE
jgi:urea transport system permease protein